MRLLVCGGRDFTDADYVFRVLDRVHAKRPISLLIEGGARGADRLARNWAINRGVAYKTENAEWKRYGKAAGFMRNKAMLDIWSPDGVVAFPGGAGTADMVRQADKADITVWELP